MLVDLVKVGVPGAIVAAGLLVLTWLGKPPAGDYRKAMFFAVVIVLSLTGSILAYVWLDRKPQIAASVTPADEFDSVFRNTQYAIEHVSFNLNFDGWREVETEYRDKKRSRVSIARNESIVKNLDTKDRFGYEFWTTGLNIDPEELKSYTPLTFTFDREEIGRDGKKKRVFKLDLPMTGLKPGSHVQLGTKFNFWNGFQGINSDDWRARIEYPTRSVTVVIRFPKQKKISKPILVSLVDAQGNKKRVLSDENPVLLYREDDRDIAQWSGLNILGKHFVLFEWEWANESGAAAESPNATSGKQ